MLTKKWKTPLNSKDNKTNKKVSIIHKKNGLMKQFGIEIQTFNMLESVTHQFKLLGDVPTLQ